MISRAMHADAGAANLYDPGFQHAFAKGPMLRVANCEHSALSYPQARTYQRYVNADLSRDGVYANLFTPSSLECEARPHGRVTRYSRLHWRGDCNRSAYRVLS
jgi:hypothetical protein